MSDLVSQIPETFALVIQKGIAPGIPSPEPRALYLVSRAPRSPQFVISTKLRPEGDTRLKPYVYRQLKVVAHAQAIVRFLTIMSEIPTQYGGVEDVYGRDTSLVHCTEYARMGDLHLAGDKAPKGIPRPTEAQKVLFDEAVAIVENWGARSGPK
ncbi:hypothetical protein V8E55_003164 [Tylopilus felleus]